MRLQKKHIIFLGSQGSGKTMLVKAIMATHKTNVNINSIEQFERMSTDEIPIKADVILFEFSSDLKEVLYYHNLISSKLTDNQTVIYTCSDWEYSDINKINDSTFFIHHTDYDNFLKICKYKKQHEEEINKLTEFWNIVECLFEDNQLKEGSEFIINQKRAFRIKGENSTDTTCINSNGDEILYIRMKSLYQFYNKEATKRNGVVLADDIIRKCFKSQGYFVGLVPSMRFLRVGASSAYAFNYTKMKSKGIVSLGKEVVSLDELVGQFSQLLEVIKSRVTQN